jgi:fumarylpyruvate hydrolase
MFSHNDTPSEQGGPLVGAMPVQLPIVAGWSPEAPIQARFAVRRILCLGRNFAEHAREMGHNPAESEPFFFCKPLTSLVCPQGPSHWRMPCDSQLVHHELEPVLALAGPVDPAQPWQAVAAVGLGLDMTKRDLQRQAKQQGRPWILAKGFDQSAVISPLMPVEPDRLDRDFWLDSNGRRVQTGRLEQMILSVPALLQFVSSHTQLGAGDLIMMGTPAGVGPVAVGDRLQWGWGPVTIGCLDII